MASFIITLTALMLYNCSTNNFTPNDCYLNEYLKVNISLPDTLRISQGFPSIEMQFTNVHDDTLVMPDPKQLDAYPHFITPKGNFQQNRIRIRTGLGEPKPKFIKLAPGKSISILDDSAQTFKELNETGRGCIYFTFSYEIFTTDQKLICDAELTTNAKHFYITN